MPRFDVDTETINAFNVEGRYLFKEYFDQDEVFAALQDYYNRSKYRFEIPKDDFDTVHEIINQYFYTLEPIDDLEEFCVIKEKYTEHADILRNSVWQTSHGNNTIFLMTTRLAVEQAVEQGATKLEDTDVEAGL